MPKKIPLGAAHRSSLRNLRLYMLVGGMPQAVNAYIDTNNLSKVDEVKRKIIKLYEDDLFKIDMSGRASKMFVSDTGLFVTLAFWDKAFTDNIIYDKLLSDKLAANLGYVYENIVAQMLTATGDRLFYHTWKKDEKHYYEIDFLLSRGNKVCPIEVKSSGYKTHASLDAFAKKYSQVVLQKYLLYTKDIQKDGNTLLLPFYMTPFI